MEVLEVPDTQELQESLTLEDFTEGELADELKAFLEGYFEETEDVYLSIILFRKFWDTRARNQEIPRFDEEELNLIVKKLFPKSLKDKLGEVVETFKYIKGLDN